MRHRIIHIVPEWPSYSQTFVIDDIKISERVFDQTLVFPLPFREKTFSSKFVNFFDFLASIPVAIRRCSMKESRDELLFLFRSRHGFRSKCLVIYVFLSSITLIRKCRIWEFHDQTVLHAHFFSTGLEIAVLVKREFPGVRIVATGHGSDVFYQSHSILEYFVRNVDLIITASNAVLTSIGQKLLNTSIDVDKKMILRYCRLPLSEFSPKPIFDKFESRKLRILTVARFHPQKGLDIALESAIALRDLGVNFSWTFVGGGSLRQELEASANESNMGNFLNFMGVQTRETVQQCMSQADIFILPSVTLHNASDGLPVVILEAMNMGAYVITTNVGGISEAIDSERGSIVEPKTEKIVQEILMIKDNKLIAIQRINSARQWVQLHCLQGDTDPLHKAYLSFR